MTEPSQIAGTPPIPPIPVPDVAGVDDQIQAVIPNVPVVTPEAAFDDWFLGNHILYVSQPDYLRRMTRVSCTRSCSDRRTRRPRQRRRKLWRGRHMTVEALCGIQSQRVEYRPLPPAEPE